MSSLILSTVAKLMLPLFLLLSVFLLLRGHNSPGGGFAGGLVATTGYILYALAFGVGTAREILRVDPRFLIAGGLALAGASGLPALILGKPYLTGFWGEISLFRLGKIAIGTPLLFDIGVYATVMGMVLTIVFALLEEPS